MLKSCDRPPSELTGRGQDGGNSLVLNSVVIFSALSAVETSVATWVSEHLMSL